MSCPTSRRAGEAKCYISRGILDYHFVFVTLFFAITCYLVTFRFAAFTPVQPTRQRLMRNKVYRICGVIMLVSFVSIGLLAALNRDGSIFWPEAAAVIAFAAAWLVKGQTILKNPAD